MVFAAQGLVFGLCVGIRVLPSRRGRFGCSSLFAGIRVLPSCFRRRPCAGRHLLFFAAAKKSRQKKAANTANISSCLRAPNGSYASHGNHVTHVRCQRSCAAPHPLHMSASHHAMSDSPQPPRWQTVCRPLVLHTHHFGPIAHAPHPVRAPSYTLRQPTHSLPPGRHIPFSAAGLSTGIRSG
ncbi:hypothetical protein SAMN04487926_107258 [Paraburkholderia steynii]|uniref:Uncharacterized protein n=1 Tax=Paraburkholderia steynii TaxID=1245441 RepID=A0A7Z7FIQ6_9BURK|nr:hypothetical protein SAMN04487926_107258 [Paraburkholderia steynii]